MATAAPRYTPFFGCMISMRLPQFEAAVRLTLERLGVELVDLEGFSCCPDPIYFKSKDKMTWLTLAARNLSVAEAAGLDIITCCSGCTATLSEARHILVSDDDLRQAVNRKLDRIGHRFDGRVQVRHVATMVRDEVGYDRVTASVIRPLSDVRVAIHYGCHLLKPSHIMQVDDPDHPMILENLVAATGAVPVEHAEKILCCGKACTDESMPPRMVREVMQSVARHEMDCMVLICPTCFDEYDFGQIRLHRLFGDDFKIPVLYYFQLLALAQGFRPEQVGLQWHKIKMSRWPTAEVADG